MSDYRFELRPAAVRDLQSATSEMRRAFHSACDALANDVRPAASRRVRARRGYRLRIDDVDVLYSVDVEILLVVINRVLRSERVAT